MGFGDVFRGKPREVPGSIKVGRKTLKFQQFAAGRNAKNKMQEAGKEQKIRDKIKAYRVRKYKTKDSLGRHRTVYALFVLR